MRIVDLKLSQNQYLFVDRFSRTYGGPLQTIMRLALEYGVKEEELLIGIQALDNGDSTAEFGIFGHFLFSTSERLVA